MITRLSLAETDMAPGELGLQHFKALRAALEALPTGDVDVRYLKTQLDKGKAALRSPLQLSPAGDSGAADLSKGDGTAMLHLKTS